MTRVGATLAAGSLLAAAALAASPPAHAEDPHGNDRIVLVGGAEVRGDEVVHDLIVVEGDVTVAGQVTGDLIAVEGDVALGGHVDGDIVTIAGKADLSPGATVGGDLLYGDEEPTVQEGAEVEGEVSDEGWSDLSDAPWTAIGAFTVWLAVSLSLLVFGVGAIAIAPRAAEAVNEQARASLGISIAVGVALLIGLPLLAFLAIVTLVGIPLGFGILLALLPLAALGYVATSVIIGRLIVSETTHPILAFLAGFGILRLVSLIPFAGGLTWLAAVVLGLGALLVAGIRRGGAGSSAPAT